jgi:hypothetical protein
VHALAERCATAPASVSRVVGLLERDAIVVRGDGGEVGEVDWPALLRRWTEDYQVESSNVTMTFLEPRGLDAFVEKIRSFGRRYAVSGSLAARRKTPVAAPRLAIAYVEDPAAAAEALELRVADRGGNVLLAVPFDPVVFDRSWSERGVTYAALSQVAAVGSLVGRSPGRLAEPRAGEPDRAYRKFSIIIKLATWLSSFVYRIVLPSGETVSPPRKAFSSFPRSRSRPVAGSSR